MRKVDCEITAEDIIRMNELYDSGMCDITSQNAAVQALKRYLKPHHLVRIFRCCHQGGYLCEIDGERIDLSCDLVDWFEPMEYGIASAGYHFQVSLPVALLNSTFQRIHYEAPKDFRTESYTEPAAAENVGLN